MSERVDALRINPSRFRADFDALSAFGATGDGGVHRPALSDAHLAARAWLREQIRQAGLEMRVDGAGNHSAILRCGPAGAPTLLLGSHLDSVPYGGRFDGALGVLAALEVVRTVQDARLVLPMNLEAIDFTDEEGTLVGFLGSGALAGHLNAELLAKPRGGRATLEEGMARAGLTDAGILNAMRPQGSLGGYLELHIEQGNRLAKAGIQIGIVTHIVGIYSYKISFLGRADHAGTTPMQDRRDAGQGASAFALAVRELLLRDYPGCVATIGNMVFAPGAFNIVPASVVVSLEFRSADTGELDLIEKVLTARASAEAERFGLGIQVERLWLHDPTPMSEQSQQAISDACTRLGLSSTPIVSGAGHDGQSLAGACPVGMVFVPSVEGASHSPRELTEWQDCVNGANVLLQSALAFAGQGLKD